jgi:phage baseplate assembly protein W
VEDVLWSDIDLDFSKTRSGDSAIYVGVDAIKSSIKNILNTPRGRDLMDRKSGVGIHELVFDPLDDLTIDFLRSSIKSDILNREPRILIKTVDVAKTSETSVNVVVVFTVIESKMEDSVSFEVTL